MSTCSPRTRPPPTHAPSRPYNPAVQSRLYSVHPQRCPVRPLPQRALNPASACDLQLLPTPLPVRDALDLTVTRNVVAHAHLSLHTRDLDALLASASTSPAPAGFANCPHLRCKLNAALANLRARTRPATSALPPRARPVQHTAVGPAQVEPWRAVPELLHPCTYAVLGY
ncbi:hypothetical protein K438DRAFT_1992537 [Mycena galopus ATCC 62051]|nr:hypothetical protein K438DRAFT_1992537 [Mycena galopus ATCC 62051]